MELLHKDAVPDLKSEIRDFRGEAGRAGRTSCRSVPASDNERDLRSEISGFRVQGRQESGRSSPWAAVIRQVSVAVNAGQFELVVNKFALWKNGSMGTHFSSLLPASEVEVIYTIDIY
jgi:hypothetical protein